MKKIFTLSLITISLLSFYSFTPKKEYRISNECEIVAFYEGIEPDDRDTKVLTQSGDIEEVEVILIPTRLDEGKYVIDISRTESNLYKIEGKNIYIETRYCYEYASYEEVVLIVESNYGYTKGKIIF